MPNVAIPAPPESIFKIKFHQVAIYAANPTDCINFWKAAGFRNWTEDECVLRGIENGKSFLMREREFFNYDILPLEFCYFQYSRGVYREDEGSDGESPFMALMAAYVENLEDQMQRIYDALGLFPYRIYDSVEHQNPYLVEKQQLFHKCLYDTRSWLGFDVKLTQRVFPGDSHYPAPLTSTERDEIYA